jgi:tetratricopeptide (TPR) repeat protein
MGWCNSHRKEIEDKGTTMGKNRLILSVITFIVILFLINDYSTAEECKEWVAKVVSVQGNVQVKRAGETEWRSVILNDTYCSGDMIRVLERSRAGVMLINQPTLRLDQNTTVTFNGIEKEKTSLIDLIKGIIHFFSRYKRSLKVTTPFANGTAEGTEFLVQVEKDRTLFTVFEGVVNASNKAGSITISSGQSGEALAEQAPKLYIIVKPIDAIQWALYYPPVLYYRPSDFSGLSEKEREMIKKSFDLYIKGNIGGAFESIKEIPEDIREPRFFTYKATLLLSVGRVDEARKNIERSLSLAPSNSHALALQSIIAVTQNDKEKALNFAKKALEADPNSVSAHIALSYADQANFYLKGALDSLKDAVRLEPENALAWARLAELWMSFGKLDEALDAATKAVSLDPNLSRTQTVLGYAYLTQIKIGDSKAAFEKAIALDQADPLPRLGFGLAEIREGDLHEGRREIEIAATLDPNNSLIRSYLGKAYYEEKRDKLSEDQLKIAEEFDPLDPTPLFYDAIRKQTINRPVEALYDMQRAIELNDNRAVYRSKLLLDSDLAARSASLGRIYTDLGFQQLALVEGWKSVNTNSADFSGHRFLADSYAALPRHEIARVSELLQSQLLQPLNITPVQPHLAESNLFILDGAGPADLSFNEFNPLFNRDRLAFQLSGIAGGQNTFGDEVVFSGVQGKASFSVGQFHYETDGFRENNDQRQDIYNAFVQYSLSDKTSIQAEFRSRDFNYGDLTLFFGQNNFVPTLRQNDDKSSVQLGFHHEFSPGSDLIGFAIYQNDTGDVFYSFPILNFGVKTDADSYGGELQHLFRSEHFNIISGVGHFFINRTDIVTTEQLIPSLLKSSDINELDTHHTNFYLYSYINYPKNITFTVGGSVDFFDRTDTDRNQVNPKFGVTWNPLPNTTLRAAVFRTLKRTLITNQTIEPTQVAGFNQFFDDEDGTKSWRYGIAIDQKFSKDIYGGTEYSQRDLRVPIIFNLDSAFELRTLKGKERLGRVYLYWTPHRWLAFSAEYQYEKITGEEEVFLADNLKTHSFPLCVKFFHPSGFSAMAKTTYIDQKGRFLHQQSGDIFFGSDHFWVVDGFLSYRLPKRFGIITVGAKNLFNKSFNYHDIDHENPVIQPKRLVFAKFTLAF